MKYVGCAIGDPKKKASIRTINLNATACDILDTLIANNHARGQGCGNYLFVYRNNRLQTTGVLKKIYGLCNELGIDKRSTHKIRKTVLSEMVNTCLQNGVCDISGIRKYAGHVDEGTLLKNYVFSTKENEMTDLLEQALATKSWTHTGHKVS